MQLSSVQKTFAVETFHPPCPSFSELVVSSSCLQFSACPFLHKVQLHRTSANGALTKSHFPDGEWGALSVLMKYTIHLLFINC